MILSALLFMLPSGSVGQNVSDVRKCDAVSPDGSSADKIQACIDAFTDTRRRVDLLLPSSPLTIQTSITIPANVRLSFSRGTVLEVKDGATVTVASIDGIVASAAKIFSVSGTGKVIFTSAGTHEQTLFPQWWGFGNGETDNGTALNATCAAITSNVTVVFPAGTYDNTRGRCDVRATVANLTFRGAGMGKTVLRYASTTDGHAFFKLKGGISGATFEDMTLEDTTSSGDYDSGVGILHYPMLGFVARRVEFKNVLGNSSIQGGDGLFVNGGEEMATALIEDCWFHNPAGNSTRDAINIGGMKEIRLHRNRIEDARIFGFEGGGAIQRLFVTENSFASSIGQAHMSNTAAQVAVITNNVFGELHPTTGETAFKWVAEGTNLADTLTLADNTVRMTHGVAFKLQTTINHGKIVNNNIAAATGFIQDMPSTIGDVDIGGNTIHVTQANGGGTLRLIRACCAPGPKIAGGLYIHNNWATSDGIRLAWVHIGAPTDTGEAWGNLRTRNVVFENNHLGSSLDDSGTNQIDGHSQVANLPDVEAGSISTRRTVSMYGLLAGDIVTAVTDEGLPVGLSVHTAVSTGDTIDYWVINQSRTNFSGSGIRTRFWPERK